MCGHLCPVALNPERFDLAGFVTFGTWFSHTGFILFYFFRSPRFKGTFPTFLKLFSIQKPTLPPPPVLLTCASLCWLSASPGETSACLASSMSNAEPSMTSRAESSMAAAAFGSMVEAATPRAACARVFRAWAVSLAATPALPPAPQPQGI